MSCLTKVLNEFEQIQCDLNLILAKKKSNSKAQLANLVNKFS